MNKEQQELSEGVEMFDPRKVESFDCGEPLGCTPRGWQYAQHVHKSDYDALLAFHKASMSRERELQAKIAVGDGSCDHCGAIPSIIMPTSLCDECADGVKRAEAAESQLLAKDALIASLNAEISRQNKAEDELLATGEKLAEEKR